MKLNSWLIAFVATSLFETEHAKGEMDVIYISYWSKHDRLVDMILIVDIKYTVSIL